MALRDNVYLLIGLAAGLTFAAMLLVFGPSLALMIVPLGPDDPLGSTVAINVVVFGGIAGVAAWGLTLMPSEPVRVAPSPLLVGAAFLLGAVGFLITLGLAGVAGAVQMGSHERPIAGTLLLGSLLILGQSASEELLFRGWMQRYIIQLINPVGGVLITAATFALFHLLGGVRGPTTVLNLLLGGILFGLLALKRGNIVPSVAAHFAWNWSEQTLAGLDPNPGRPPFGSILDLDLVGRSIWGGSTEGLNASLGMTCALVALVVPVLAWPSGFTLARQ